MLDVLARKLKPTNQPLAIQLTLGPKSKQNVFNLMYYVLEGKQDTNIGKWGSTPNNSQVTNIILILSIQHVPAKKTKKITL